MKIIWSLFDSETAITQGLNSDKYKVYSIGLPSSSAVTDNFIKIDLSRKSCIKKLSKLPKPDVIFASPPCETWVLVSVGNVNRVGGVNRNHNEYNLYWQHGFKPNDFTLKHKSLRLLGQKTAYWTFKIIDTFKPDLWVIENGSSSLIFKYLCTFFGLIGVRNRTYYSAYNKDFPMKPTTFYSNKKIFLRNIRVFSNISTCDSVTGHKRNDFKGLTSYSDRSKVPLEIYNDILFFFEGKGQLTLF